MQLVQNLFELQRQLCCRPTIAKLIKPTFNKNFWSYEQTLVTASKREKKARQNELEERKVALMNNIEGLKSDQRKTLDASFEIKIQGKDNKVNYS